MISNVRMVIERLLQFNDQKMIDHTYSEVSGEIKTKQAIKTKLRGQMN